MIVNQSYYLETYKGKETAEFDRLNDVSQAFVENLTKHNEAELIKIPESVLERVRKAICAEIEYLCSLGGVKAVNAKQDIQKTSESYGGSYSYSLDSKNMASIRYVNGVPYAPMIDIYLSETGLLYSGVDYV